MFALVVRMVFGYSLKNSARQLGANENPKNNEYSNNIQSISVILPGIYRRSTDGGIKCL